VNAFDTVRTLLFTPGNRPDRFSRAEATGADGQVIDLEDAVSLGDKDAARELVLDYFKTAPAGGRFLRCLRINSLKTPAGLKDASALIDSGVRPDALLVPKVESAAEIVQLDRLLGPRVIPLAALIETAVGLRCAEAVALSSPSVVALSFGGVDLAADLGAELAWEPMLAWRCLVVRAAAAAGIAVWDMPYLHLRDADDAGVREETRRARALGFTGKLAIHPKHIAPILGVFTPSAEEAARAQRIVDAYDHAGGNACEVDGKMIDVPVYRAAKRTLALAAR